MMIQKLPQIMITSRNDTTLQSPNAVMKGTPIHQQPRKRAPFTPEEDKKILGLVQMYQDSSQINWYFVASQLQGRNVRQCRERYQLFLSDGIKRKVKWTEEEDKVLLHQYEIIGPRWKKMEEFFEGRTSYSIKNRFISLTRHQNKFFNYDLNTKSSEPKEVNIKLQTPPDVNLQQENNEPQNIFELQIDESALPEYSMWDMNMETDPDFDFTKFEIFE